MNPIKIVRGSRPTESRWDRFTPSGVFCPTEIMNKETIGVNRNLTQAMENQRGFALVVALITLLVLSTLTTAFVYVSQSEGWNTISYKSATQAHYLAEAGVERTLNWFRYDYLPVTGTPYTLTTYPVQYNGAQVVLSGRNAVTANYPDSAMRTDFSNKLHSQSLAATGLDGSYSSSATMIQSNKVGAASGLEMWRVTSEGTVAGARGGTVQVEGIVEQSGVPVFNYALYTTGTGCAQAGTTGIRMSGGDGITTGIIDSWDSGLGTYAATKQATGGDVGSNGNTNLSSTGTVYGTLSTPLQNQATGNCSSGSVNPLTLSGSGSVKEAKIQLAAPITFDDPPDITPDPPLTDLTISSACASTPGCTVLGKDPVTGRNQWALAPGTYGNIKMSGGDLIFSAGIYNLNGITQFSGGAQLRITSGPVRVNVQGKKTDGTCCLGTPISMSGGGIFNTTGLPDNLSFVYGGTGDLTFTGGSGTYAALYAPHADVTISGSGDWYGGMVSHSYTATGGSSLHYDDQLRENWFLKYTWRLISLSQNKF